MLQIIHGSIIFGSLIFSLNKNFLNTILITNEWREIALVIFFFISFITGVMIDFLADILEGILIKFNVLKPPIFSLLKKGGKYGIVLAHHKEVFDDLCSIAAKNSDCKDKDFGYYKDGCINKDKDIINYIFQVAKNQVFREGKDYQKEQIESFFMLYIFSRNLAFSFLIAIILLLSFSANWPMPEIHWTLCLALLVLLIIAFLSSYRYFIYYSRIILGSIFKPNK